MIQINTKDGKTHNFDITKKAELDQFKNLVDDPHFAQKITGIGIFYKSAHHVFPIPSSIRVTNYFAEVLIETQKTGGAAILTGERLSCYIGGAWRVSMTVWFQKKGPRVTSFEFKPLGRQVFKPAYETDTEIETETIIKNANAEGQL